MLLLGELPLRRAARSEEGRSCFGGSSRCAGLPVRAGREEALSGGAPAARGCWNTEKRRLLLGELPLHGAAGLQTGGRCFWWSSRFAGLLDWRKEEAAWGGSSRCARVLDRRKEEAALGGAPAARGCLLEQGGRRLFLGELPLRGAAGIQRRGGCSWGSSRCAGLLDYRQEEAAFGGDPAARACLIGEKCGCFWWSPSCVGLAGRWVEGKKRLLLGEAASCAARGFSSSERKRLIRDDGSSCIIFEKCHDNILRRVVSNSGVGMGKDICTSASLLLACRIYVSM